MTNEQVIEALRYWAKHCEDTEDASTGVNAVFVPFSNAEDFSNALTLAADRLESKVSAAPAAGEGEDGPSYRTCRCNAGFVHQEKDCPAAQAADESAASPKHDEGRELRPCPFCGGAAERIDFGPGDFENEGGSCIACTACQASGPVEFGRKENFISNWNRRALATQPAARRVTDEDVSKACAAYTIALNNYGARLQRKSAHEVAMRAALESFAQPQSVPDEGNAGVPAEGVSGG